MVHTLAKDKIDLERELAAAREKCARLVEEAHAPKEEASARPNKPEATSEVSVIL